ncbi:pilus assembly protein PilM [Thiocapsa imhoffii]|uniref:Pilus assembly protein PilM n=1 Tax=Thiocapsa imhoffii TaxID=382777 RepID=A0A9X0WI23_9GAMM|nr:pilus assembly protein PilM [Thiocapsa imhoffii]MBK1644978.1 pilus assembly protein PilM [Thiocapsa imhoffii]
MFGLTRQRKPTIGIDISSTAIKLIELSQLPNGSAATYRVEHYSIEPMPPAAVIEKKIADVDLAAKALSRAISQSGTKAKHGAVAVAGSAVITKVIAMAATLKDADIESQIQLEADQYIPYPLEEVNLDFQVVGPTKGNPSMVDVLLVASRQENVDDRVSVLEGADVMATVVDVEAYAMENACDVIIASDPEAGSAATLAVADVGSATTTLYVLREGQIVYTREQNFGGQQLLDEVQRRYSLARDVAMQKIVDGDVAEGYATDVLAPFKEALSQQIGRALQFFYSGTSYNRVDHILLAGRPASLPGIDQLVSERLNIPAEVANPFRHMSLAPGIKAQELMRAAPGMMIAVGLALRGFD